MRYNLKKVDDCLTKLNVELSEDDLRGYTAKAEDEIGRELEIDGFRKGKVPRDLIRRNIDSSKILEGALRIGLKDSLAKVLAKENLDIISTSDLEVKESTSEHLVYELLLTLFPEVDINMPVSFKISRHKIEVSRKEIDEALNSVMASRATLLDKEGAAENGDRVEIDFEVRSDGQLIEGGESKNHPLILGGKNFIPGFEENLIGMRKNEEKNFFLLAPQNYFEKSIAGKKLEFKVRVNDIRTVRLPKLDDGFARSLGKFENLDQLFASIKEGIHQEKAIKERQRVRTEVLNRIIKTSDIRVPDFMVDQQLDLMISNLDRDLHTSNMELSLYLAHIGKTQDDLKKDWKNEAEKQVKITLILHKIAKDKSISIDPIEVEAALDDTVQAMVSRGGANESNINLDSLRVNIANQMINDRALNFLEGLYTG